MKKNTSLLILIILLSLMILIFSVILILFIDMKSGNKVIEEDTKVYEEVYIYSPAKSIVSNVKDSKKYIRFNYAIEVGDLIEFENIKKSELMITDIVITIIRDKCEAEYVMDNIQETIKNDIKAQVTEKLELLSVLNIYITEFVIQ